MKGDARKGRLLLRSKRTDLDGDLWDMVVWIVPESPQSPSGVRYRFAFVPFGSRRPAVLYDNHFPKGPHKHLGDAEEPMVYDSLEALEAEFKHDVMNWKETTRRKS